MIIDTSVLIAMLEQEPEAEGVARALAATSERSLSAANFLGDCCSYEAEFTCAKMFGCPLENVEPFALSGCTLPDMRR